MSDHRFQENATGALVKIPSRPFGSRRADPEVHPTIARKLINELKRPPELTPAEAILTDREVQVLKLVAQGFTNQQIADRLTLSEWTVRTRVRNILDKLHLANRTQAALYALKEGLADLNYDD